MSKFLTNLLKVTGIAALVYYIYAIWKSLVFTEQLLGKSEKTKK